jgi:hypothetical protein
LHFTKLCDTIIFAGKLAGERYGVTAMKNDPIMTSSVALKNQPNSVASTEAGFRFGDKGAHTSRTIMLSELTILFQECPQDAAREDYAAAVIEQNYLGKRTVSTRKLSFQRMSELYSFDPSLLLFRILRQCWQSDEKGRPLLALLAAMARDPFLRVTSIPILKMKPGEELARQEMTDILREGVGDRLNDSSLDKVVRNTASSWTQSGHLKGRSRKTRQRVEPTPISTAYALLLGYILGSRGERLFRTLWAQTLDKNPEELVYFALDAKRLGFLDMSQSGGVTDISFARILTEEERRLIHGKN